LEALTAADALIVALGAHVPATHLLPLWSLLLRLEPRLLARAPSPFVAVRARSKCVHCPMADDGVGGVQAFTATYVKMVARTQPLSFKAQGAGVRASCAPAPPATDMGSTGPAYALLPMVLAHPGDHVIALQAELEATAALQFPLYARQPVTAAVSATAVADVPAVGAETGEVMAPYLACVDGLIGALAATGSVAVLPALASVVCREPGHPRTPAVRAALATLARQADGAQPAAALAAVHAALSWMWTLAEDRAYPAAQRRAAVQTLLLPLLAKAPGPVLIEFLSAHVPLLLKAVAAPLPLCVPTQAPAAPLGSTLRIIHGRTLMLARHGAWNGGVEMLQRWWTRSGVARVCLSCSRWRTSACLPLTVRGPVRGPHMLPDDVLTVGCT
jgi:hypothetical protein